MAHFAKIGKGNIVEQVVVVSNDIATTEQAGVDFLNNLYKTRDVWKQTCPDKTIRKNYAGIGYTYDEDKDSFIPKKPYASWILNETTCLWEAPVAYPETYDKGLTDEQGNPVKDKYYWNENNINWELI